MNVDIRKSIKENFKNAGKEDIIESIIEAIEASEDITLPGLGVFFELLWKNSNEDDKDFIINTIQNGL